MLQFLAAPFVASLILTGIHAYLGVHVVQRGVIFVDLSLAQIASLGATIAVLVPALGGDPHSPGVYWMSLGFTIIGALIFSMIRGHEANVPQEAIIGITYAVASAAVIVVMSKAPGESEHLKDMVERFFRDLTQSRLRRGIFHDVEELIMCRRETRRGRATSTPPGTRI